MQRSWVVLGLALLSACDGSSTSNSSAAERSGKAASGTQTRQIDVEGAKADMKRAAEWLADAADAASASKRHEYAARSCELLDRALTKLPREGDDYWQARWQRVYALARSAPVAGSEPVLAELEGMLEEDPSQVKILVVVVIAKWLKANDRRDEAAHVIERLFPRLGLDEEDVRIEVEGLEK